MKHSNILPGMALLTLLVSHCGGTQGTTDHSQHNANSHNSSDGAVSSDGASTSDAAASQSATDAASDAQSAASNAANDAGFARPTGDQAAQITQLFNDGSAAYSRGDLQAAVTAFRQAYELYPTPELAFNVARVYERMGSVDEAIQYFQLALNGSPSATQRTDVERRISELRAYAQRRADNIAQAPPSADATQQEGVTWLNRGVTLYRRRQYRQALIAFETAQNYLDTPELYFNLAVTQEQLANYDRALLAMQQYLRTRQGTGEEAYVQERIRQIQAHLRQ